MRRSALIATLTGILSLGMGMASLWANETQDWPPPGQGGYNPPPSPDPRAYERIPGSPYNGGDPYSPGPSGYTPGPSGYSSGYNQPTLPNPNTYGTMPGYSSGLQGLGLSYPGNYGTSPLGTPGLYDRYDSNGLPPYPHVLQPHYYPPAGSDPGGYGNASVPPFGVYPAPVPAPTPVFSPVAGLAVQLAQQADAFLQAFVPTARVVPEGDRFIADAATVRDGAIRLQQAAASGAPPAGLVVDFNVIAATWQRMEARMQRISRGRIGPNIAKALEMGRTIDQIRASLP